jgi:hypothetical protein
MVVHAWKWVQSCVGKLLGMLFCIPIEEKKSEAKRCPIGEVKSGCGLGERETRVFLWSAGLAQSSGTKAKDRKAQPNYILSTNDG